MTIVNTAASTPPISPIAKCSPSIIDLILDIGAPSTLRVANSESRSERFISRVLKSTAMAMMTPNPRMALKNPCCFSISESKESNISCFWVIPIDISPICSSNSTPSGRLRRTVVASSPIASERSERWK